MWSCLKVVLVHDPHWHDVACFVNNKMFRVRRVRFEMTRRCIKRLLIDVHSTSALLFVITSCCKLFSECAGSLKSFLFSDYNGVLSSGCYAQDMFRFEWWQFSELTIVLVFHFDRQRCSVSGSDYTFCRVSIYKCVSNTRGSSVSVQTISST